MEPKISTAEAILLIIFALIADVINLIPLINILATVITFTLTQLYFRMKGIKATFNMVMQFLEFIPVISALPLTTVGVIVVIILDHNQKAVSDITNTEEKKTSRNAPFIQGVTQSTETSSQRIKEESQPIQEQRGKVIPFPSKETSEKPRLSPPIKTRKAA